MSIVPQSKQDLLKERARRLATQRSGASSCARFAYVIQQPKARRLQHSVSGNACISGHHAPSHEKRHTTFHYFTDHPKSEQWDTLAALKPQQITDVLQLPCAAEKLPKHPRKALPTFLKYHGLYFYFNVVVTITHHLGLGRK